MKELGQAYPDAGYRSMFNAWLWREKSHPYGSYGNGAAMRVSPIGLYALTLRDALEGAKISAEVSHSHPEGIKGAQAVAAAVWMANNGYPKNAIREYIERKFGYDMSRTIDEIRPTYKYMNEVNMDISRLEKSTFSPYFFFLPRLRGTEGSGMARYLRYELARNLPTNRQPMPITSLTNSYLEKKASATRISVSDSSSIAFDLTRETYQSSMDVSTETSGGLRE